MFAKSDVEFYKWLIHNTKEIMLWNYKTFHFSPKMRQMRYPIVKQPLTDQDRQFGSIYATGKQHLNIIG